MKFQKSDFIQNTDLSDAIIPKPCTTAQDVCDANAGLFEQCTWIDTKTLPTCIDRLIKDLLLSHTLDADIYHGRIFNPNSGKFLKPKEHHNGYLYVSLDLRPVSRIIDIPVHRFVYYAAHHDIIVGEDFDIHHIDGNKQNNRYENLQKVNRRFHTKYGAFSSQVETEAGYLHFIGKIKHGSIPDAYTIKALRVCANQLPRGSSRRTIIFAYFSEKLHISHEYCKSLSSLYRVKSILPATPEEEAQILKEYAWLIEKANAGRRVRKNKNAAEEC